MFGTWATKSALQLIGYTVAGALVVAGSTLAIVHNQDHAGTSAGVSSPAGSAKAGATGSASDKGAGASTSGQAAAAGSSAGVSAGAATSVPAATSLLPTVKAPSTTLPTLPTVKLPTLPAPTLAVPTLAVPTLPTTSPTVPDLPVLSNLGIPVPVVALGILGLSPYAAASFPLVIPATPGVTKHFCFGIDGSATCRPIIVPATGTMNMSMSFTANTSLLAPTFTPNSCTGGYSITLSGVTPGAMVQATVAGLSVSPDIDSHGKSVRASLCD